MGKGVEPVWASAQPVDAAAAVMDGGLLGASETAYASRATLVVALAVYGLLSFVPRMFPGLVGVWLCLKGLSVGRTLAAGKMCTLTRIMPCPSSAYPASLATSMR
jgi:Na+-driven multidrug efflux pump